MIIFALNAALSKADWSNVQQAPHTDSSWLSWKSTFLKIAAEFVPSKMIRKLRPKLPCMTPGIETEIRLKHILFRRFKRTGTTYNRTAFSSQRKKVTRLLRRAERAHILTLSSHSYPFPERKRVLFCERLVHGQLQKLFFTHLSDNQLQSGFRKGDNTSHQLFRLVQTWSDALNSRKLVGVVFPASILPKHLIKSGTEVSLPNPKLLACVAVLWTGLLATFPTELSKRELAVASPTQPKYSLEFPKELF